MPMGPDQWDWLHHVGGVLFTCLCPTVAAGPVSLLTMWTNRITVANSRKHQEFTGRVNSVNNKFELYQQLKDENGCVNYQSSATLRLDRSSCIDCVQHVVMTCCLFCLFLKHHYMWKLVSYASSWYVFFNTQDGRSWKWQGLQMMFSPIHRFTPPRMRLWTTVSERLACHLILPKQGCKIKWSTQMRNLYFFFFTHDFVDNMFTYCVTQ